MSNEIFTSNEPNQEFAEFVIPGSEARQFDLLAERMRSMSPTLGELALKGEDIEG